MKTIIKFDDYTAKIERQRKTKDNYNVSVRVFQNGWVLGGWKAKEGTTDKEILKDVFFAIDKGQLKK